MAKPKADLPSAEAIRALADGEGRLAVKVTPAARVSTLQIADGRLVARVRAAPEDGKANTAVLELLADSLGIAPSRLRLLRGATSREKQVQIR
jgi:uncharacterized protein YggU (UPF0235/DUF167 family)